MNILHHKSWHVRNKDNIIRVKRDEAKAAEEEKQRLKRQSIAESEARLNILRSRASVDFVSKEKHAEKATPTHINLFEQEETGKRNGDKNKETELEKKQEKEKFEKKIGLLKYLVDEDLDLKTQPWYKKSKIYTVEDNRDIEVDLKRKIVDDPLTNINLKLNEKNKKKKKSDKHNRDKDHNKKKKSEPSKSDFPIKKTKTIEELRVERLKRETAERTKANILLYGNQETVKEKVEFDDRKRKYNNQFNPESSRY